MQDSFDTVVIGAGMAGASLAANLAQAGQRVALLEMEAHPGYHTTGRSAAIYAPTYGPKPIRALTRASLGFFTAPPAGFCEQALLSPFAAAFLAREDQVQQLDALQRELADAHSVERLERSALHARLPILRADYGAAALWDNSTSEIDVAALHQGYLRLFTRSGGTLKTRAAVQALERERRSGAWRLDTPQVTLRAHCVVNAAGAWADALGQLAGAEQIGLQPKRRTALMIAPPEGYDLSALPLIVDVEEQFYLKPDAGKLLISPANEDPEVPCDVQPDEMDIALCVDRIERAFDITVRRIERSWAGLRSFVADKSPVAGFSEQAEGFYWLAGQGGYGIQSAPALAQLAAADIIGADVPAHILAQGLDPATIRPARAGLGLRP